MRRIVFLFFLFLFSLNTAAAQQKKYRFSENKMGSPFNIVFYCDDSLKAVSISRACFQLVDSFNMIFSDYDPASELGRINTNAGDQPKAVSAILYDIIDQSKLAYSFSSHSFDITIGSLSRVWRKARKEKIFPPDTVVANAKTLAGFSKLKIDTKHHTIVLPRGTQLDLGGIAKGYVAQKIVDYLKQQGISEALADAGGDMAMSGSPSGGWIVGVNLPEQTDELFHRKLQLQNMAVATSGDAYQYILHDGKKYSHIIDPRTGYGITSQRNTTVIAPNGTLADWLATACSILSIDEALSLAKQMHAELMISEIEHNNPVIYTTPGFEKYWQKK